MTRDQTEARASPRRRTLGLVLSLSMSGCLAQSAAVFVLTLAALWSADAARIHQDRAVLALSEASLTEDEVGELIEANRQLSALDAFAPATGTRDGGELLNPVLWLDHLGPGSAQEPVWWTSEEALEEVRAEWRGSPENVPSSGLSILEALLEFDRWDPTSSGAYAEVVARPPHVPALDIPMPYVPSLQTLARARLAKGLVDGDIIPALKEVRHLADLARDAEPLLFQMVSLAVLGIERQGYEEALTRGLITAEEWTPVSREHHGLARRATWSTIAVYLGYAPPGSVQRVVEHGVPRFVRCAALSESTTLLPGLKWALGRRFPGEPDLSWVFEATQADLATAPCRLALERQYWAHPGWSSAMWEGPDADRVIKIALALPWIRGGVALQFWALASEEFVSPWRVDQTANREDNTGQDEAGGLDP